jgi:ATP-binding cassette subfamily C protein LapB
MARLYFNTCNSNIKKVETKYDNCHEEIEDTLQNLLSIYTSKKIPDEKGRIENINTNTHSEQYNAGICNRKFRIYFSIVNVFLFIALNYVAYKLFENGKIKVENLVSIFILNYTILGSLVGLYDSAKDFMNVKSHVELIDNFVNELPNTDTSKQTKTIPNPEKGLDIRFKDIVYTPGNSKEPLFDKINLRIYPRQKIAVMGGIGSGKTTLMKIAVGLQPFQAGNVFINEVPINEIDINDLRKNIIYIPQHPKLFNRTLRENLTYGLTKDITAEKILDFMKQNGFNELEEIFRKRMDEKVGKTGQTFSGGQRAMIWFLRASMQNAPMIIADEPASALDPQSTQQIKKMIDIIAKNKSVVIITHDMELTDNMDRIITFDKGKIKSDVSKNQKQSNNW